MQALEFDGDAVLKIGEKNHIIAIFVGTLMKQYKDGTQFLSGTSACCWYINENDVPAVRIDGPRGGVNWAFFNF